MGRDWASRIQRAADAAALAAVVEMPDPSSVNAAVDAAARNGYRNGDNAIVTITALNTQRGKVEIEAFAPSYLGGRVTDGVDITSFATAEYSLPVPMGRPTAPSASAPCHRAGCPSPTCGPT